MVKTLTAIGNSLGLIIERPILDLLNIDRDTKLEVRTEEEAKEIGAAVRREELRVAQVDGQMAWASPIFIT